MKIAVISSGKSRAEFLKAAVSEYAKRIGGFADLSLVEIAEQKLPDNPSPVVLGRALEREAVLIREKTPKGFFKAALCVEGEQLSSEGFAALIKDGNTAFLVGSSYGLAESVKGEADFRLSLSKMTFPHGLARVLLLEQIYRGLCINANKKYHK